jgi:hypothetical protein
MGQAVFAARGITSLVTAALQADGAGGVSDCVEVWSGLARTGSVGRLTAYIPKVL